MKIQQEVSKSGGIDTSRTVVQKPNYLAALDRYAKEYDNRPKEPGPDPDSLALQDAAGERAAIDQATYSEIEEIEGIARQHPEMFADGVLSDEERAALRNTDGLIERIDSLRDNFRRKAALRVAQQRWLNPKERDVSRLKPATVEAINNKFDIKFADEPYIETYGEELYKSVKERTGGRFGPLDFVLEAARRKQVADIKYGVEVGGITETILRNQAPQLLNTSMQQELSKLHQAWNTRGAILPDEQAAYLSTLDRYVQDIKGKHIAAAEEARKQGKYFDTAKMNEDLDKQASVLADLGKQFGKDPTFTARMNELYTAMGKVPILAVGTDFTQMVEVTQRTGYPVDVVINLLQQNPDKMREILVGGGLPPLSNDVMSEFAKRLSDGIHAMATMDASKLGDPSLARFQQYLAGMWSGSKTGAPKQAVSTQLNTLNLSKDPVQTGVYFANNPAFGPNVDAYPEMKKDYVSAVRNGVTLMMTEMNRLGVRMVPDGRVQESSPYATGGGAGAPVVYRPASDNIATGVKAWKKYLNSPEALRMLGPELRDEFNAALEGRSVQHGYSTQRIQDILPTLASASAIDLEMHAKGIKQTLFRTKKSDPQYKVLQQAELAVQSEIQSRNPDAAAKKPQPQAAWKTPAPEVTAKLKAEYDPIIDKYAQEYDVPADLAKAIAMQESRYDPNAISKAGAKGVMQLRDRTGAALGLRDNDVFDPEKNIRAGIEHLARLYHRVFKPGDYPEKDRLEMVVAAYNAGEGTVKKAMHDRTWEQAKAALPGDETRDYIQKVLK